VELEASLPVVVLRGLNGSTVRRLQHRSHSGAAFFLRIASILDRLRGFRVVVSRSPTYTGSRAAAGGGEPPPTATVAMFRDRSHFVVFWRQVGIVS